MADHDHDWVDGWQKAEPSYRWTETQQWPDDIPMRACRICGPENGKGWMAADWADGGEVTPRSIDRAAFGLDPR